MSDATAQRMGALMRLEDRDEGGATPVGQLQAAVAALREFVVLSAGAMAVDRPGWRYVPDAYRVLSELSALVGMLPQALGQVDYAVRHEFELNLIEISPLANRDPGSPAAAVAAMSSAIAHARGAADDVRHGAAAATAALTRAGHGGREIDLVKGIPRVGVRTSPYPAGHRHRNGLVGTTYSARCECGWPQLPAIVDRQTVEEADAEAWEHAAATGHDYDPPAEIAEREEQA